MVFLIPQDIHQEHTSYSIHNINHRLKQDQPKYLKEKWIGIQLIQDWLNNSSYS